MHMRLVAPHRTGFQRRLQLGLLLIILLLPIHSIIMTLEKTVSKNDVYDVYRAEKIECESPSEGKPMASKLQATAILFLITVNPMLKFHTTVQAVINQSVRNATICVPRQAARAFRHIEKFALNLVDFPWQKEFKMIRLYTGFWKLKIERHLSSVIPLFERMGYRQADDDTLRLQDLASRDTLIELAADCYNASVELEMYGDILESVDQKGFTIQDVHNCRTSIAGSKEEAVDWINQNCKASFRKIHENFEKRASHSDETSLPHIEQLELDEGHGDSGFISKTNSKELSNNKLPEAALTGKVKHTDDDFPPPSPVETPRVLSVDEEDVFAPGEWEDQIRNSMKFIGRTQAKPEHQVPAHLAAMTATAAMSGTGSGSSSEWDHVRRGLRQKFGADYYAGLRGDILEKGGEEDDNNSSSGPHRSNSAPQKAMPSTRVITAADVHTSPTTKGSSPSQMSPGGSGKIAGINKSTSRKAPAPPVSAKPATAQYQQQNSQLEELYQNSQFHLENNSSLEISRPPPPPAPAAAAALATYPLLGTQYVPPIFTTFGHMDSPRGVGQVQCYAGDPTMTATHLQQQYDNDAMYDILQSPAMGNGSTGYEVLARRMYQADSLQSLNKEDLPLPPPPPPQQSQEELYTKPIKAVVPQQYPGRQYNDLSRGSGSVTARANGAGSGPIKTSQTAPIVPRRPAPKVPTRSHQTEPLNFPSSKQQLQQPQQQQQQQQQPKSSSTPAGPHCRHCTFANAEGATLCAMCSKPLVAAPVPTTKTPGSTAPMRPCPKCTYSNPYTATKCKICREEFSQ